jgi:hypothetical protein
MKYLVIALSLAFILTDQAFALTPEQEAYFLQMATGKCWGKCAYLGSMAECISCGLSYHGVQHKAAVVYYCRKLQPKCGH